jgi:CelD/BcsL family acetyltransferase involved in cellulose biosynthesis
VNSKSHLLLNDKYSIKEITDLGEFEKLRTAWDNLAEKQGASTPFLCFDWFKVWLAHFLKGDKLLILLLYKEHEIVVIAPFLIKTESYKGININRIELIGNVYSPFRYFLFSELNDEERIRNLSFIFQSLFKDYKNWDVLELTGIPEENKCFDVLKMAVKQRRVKYADFVCFGDWYMDEIECSGDEYFNQLPERIRKDVSYCKRRLQKMGKCEFKLIRNGDEIDHHMDLYYAIYSKSWQEREGIGPTFHRDLAKMAVRNGWLRLGFLCLDGSPIASQFWISCNGCAFILKTVYDQDYKKYSPGKILTSEIVKFVIDFDKVKAIDYVQGDETYKQDWTPKRRERKSLLVFNSSIKGQYLGFMINQILPVLNKNKCLRNVKELIKKYLV